MYVLFGVWMKVTVFTQETEKEKVGEKITSKEASRTDETGHVDEAAQGIEKESWLRSKTNRSCFVPVLKDDEEERKNKCLWKAEEAAVILNAVDSLAIIAEEPATEAVSNTTTLCKVTEHRA